MGFINSAMGQINEAIVLDNTGESLPQVIQLGRAMEKNSKLYCLLNPNIHVLPQLAHKMLKESNYRVGVFSGDLRNLTIKKIKALLSIGSSETIRLAHEQLIQSIIPQELYNNPIVIKLVFDDDKDMHWLPAADYIFVRVSETKRNTIISYGGQYLSKLKELLPTKYTVTSSLPSIPIKNGDLIVMDDFLLIGIRTYLNYAKHNVGATVASFKDAIITTYYPVSKKNGFAPKIHIIGYEEAIFSDDLHFYHLDLYLNYAGIKENKHLLFLAQIEESTIEKFGTTKQKKWELKYLQQRLDDVYTELTSKVFAAKFKVERLPIVVDDQYNIFTFNNSITEIINDANKKCYTAKYCDISSDTARRPVDVNNSVGACHRSALDGLTCQFDPKKITLIDVNKSLMGEVNQSLHCFISILSRG